MVVGALRSKWIEAVRARGVVVETAEIVVTDRNILHTFRGTDHVRVPSSRKNSGGRAKIAPLDLDWYRSLPLHLATPKAVLLDDTGKKPTVLLVFDHPDRKLRLVLELNVPVKKLNGVFNTVVSGRVVSPDDIRADIGRGIELLEGKV